MKKNRSGAKHSRDSFGKGLQLEQRRRHQQKIHEQQQAGGPKHHGGEAREDRNP